MLSRDGEPLPGVVVAVRGHEEYGNTLTRADGTYHIALEGSARRTLTFRSDGFVPVDRHVEVVYRTFAPVPDVVMTRYAPAETIDLGSAAAFEVVRGPVESDIDGPRQATVLFPAGTGASAVTYEADGSETLVDLGPVLTVRATELSVGPDGREAMPAELPPTSAIT